MKKTVLIISALTFFVGLCVPANATPKEEYNPVKALREGNNNSEEPIGIPQKKRRDAITLSIAPEYFFDFGSDLPDADGWGASIAAAVLFNSDTPKWDFVGELEFLAFSAEGDDYNYKDRRVKESLQSANLLVNAGLCYSFSEDFSLEALLGFGFGVTYGEIKGDDFKTSSSGNWTTTFSLKVRGEYHLNENWGVFAAYRFAYISPSIASKIADWHNLDLFSQSVELGLRYRF